LGTKKGGGEKGKKNIMTRRREHGRAKLDVKKRIYIPNTWFSFRTVSFILSNPHTEADGLGKEEARGNVKGGGKEKGRSPVCIFTL